MTTIEFGQLNATHTGLRATIETDGGTATGTLLKVEHAGDVFRIGTFAEPQMRVQMVKDVTVTIGSFGEHTFRATQQLEIHDEE